MNTIEVSCTVTQEDYQEAKFIDFIQKVLHYLTIDTWELSLVLCSDSFIKELNLRYRGKDEPTDVLSFTQELVSVGDRIYAGDIVVSLDSVRGNALRFGVDFREELRRVIIHGILHLTGMDHQTNSSSEPMLIKQEQILRSLEGETLF